MTEESFEAEVDCKVLLDHIGKLAFEEVDDAQRANDILLAISETTIKERPVEIESWDAESFGAEDKKKPTTNLRAIRRRRKLKALGFKDAESIDIRDACVVCEKKPATEGYWGDVVCESCAYNYGRMHSRYKSASCGACGYNEELQAYDLMRCDGCHKSMCSECPGDKQLCSECSGLNAESFGADEQKETPQKWLQRKMKPYRMDRLQRRAESGPIVIDGYMPKRVEVFRDTVLFYIGDSAEMRYGHSEAQRKVLGEISIIDPNGIRREDVEKILKREWDGRFFLFEEGGTFVGDERTYGSEGFDQVYCSKCKRWGYSDQMGKDNGGYLCTRCARPDIDWVAHDKKYGASKSHRYYKPPVKEDKDSITMRYLKRINQKRSLRKGEPFSWLIIGIGAAIILGANKIGVRK